MDQNKPSVKVHILYSEILDANSWMEGMYHNELLPSIEKIVIEHPKLHVDDLRPLVKNATSSLITKYRYSR